MRKFIFTATLFILMNLLFIGILQVYKVSYNTMNNEQITMISVSYSEKSGVTDVELLGNKIELDIVPKKISGDDLYTLHSLMFGDIKEIMYIIGNIS